MIKLESNDFYYR